MTTDDPGSLPAAMVADYMDQGLLENIILMFRHDPGLYPMVAELLQDERIRVRMGAVALVESLAELDPGGMSVIATAVAPLLTDPSATIRGDAASHRCRACSPLRLPLPQTFGADQGVRRT